jgi:hypothetical protein
MRIPFILGAISIAGFSTAFTGVVPNAFASTEAPGTFSLTATAVAGRTYMYTIDSSQLTAFVNSNISGMSFRLGNAATAAWPPVATSFSRFDVWFGAGVDPASMSGTFASNFTAGSTQVRGGGLTFNPGAVGIGGGGTVPNPFGPDVDFNLGSYLYTGGDLAILMRFSGQVGATNQPAFDAVAATDTANGWGTSFAGRWTSDQNGLSGGNANLLVTRFTATAVPEPATMAALGLGVAAILRRRRK